MLKIEQNGFYELHENELFEVDGGVIPPVVWLVVKIVAGVAAGSFAVGAGYELIFGK